jgi:hypothetical protein
MPACTSGSPQHEPSAAAFNLGGKLKNLLTRNARDWRHLRDLKEIPRVQVGCEEMVYRRPRYPRISTGGAVKAISTEVSGAARLRMVIQRSADVRCRRRPFCCSGVEPPEGSLVPGACTPEECASPGHPAGPVGAQQVSCRPRR